MKRILVLLLLVLMAGCTSKEDRRDALFENALRLEQSGRYDEAKAEARNALKLDSDFASAYLLLGRCDTKEQDWHSALAAFARAHEISPENIEALENLGRITFLGGDTAKAAQYIDEAAALAPDNTAIKLLRAGILLRSNDFSGARVLLEDVLKAEPDNEEALTGMATVHISAKEMEKAREVLQKGYELYPDSVSIANMLMTLSLQNREYAAALSYVERLLKKFPENEGLTVRQSEILLLTNKAEEALDSLNAFVAAHPQAELARARIAELNILFKRFDRALELLDAAPEQTPRLRLTRAMVLLKAGRIDDAVAVLRPLADDPQAGDLEPKARLGLAEIYIQKRNISEALAELDTLIRKNPGDFRALALRGRLYISLKRHEEAINDLRTVHMGDPDDNSSGLALADAQNASGNTSAAEETLNTLLERSPGYIPAYLTLANVRLQNKNIEAALAALRAGEGKVTDSPELAFAEADILTSEKRYDEAEAVLEKTGREAKFKPASLLRLAGVMGRKGDFAQAAACFTKILALNPDSTIAAEGYIRAEIAAKNTGAALAFAEKRQAERPEDPAAVALTGEAALAAQDTAKAEAAFLRALELAPQWDQPLTRLSQIYTHTGRENEALDMCKNALQKNPDAIAPALLLALLQQRQGALKAAEDTYRNLLIKQPNLLPAANNLAYLITQHSPDEASLKEAEELAVRAAASGTPPALDTLGWVLHLRGNNTESEKSLRAAHEGARENLTIAYHLAVVLAKLERKAEAKSLLTEALGTEGDFAEREEARKLLETLD